MNTWGQCHWLPVSCFRKAKLADFLGQSSGNEGSFDVATLFSCIHLCYSFNPVATTALTKCLKNILAEEMDEVRHQTLTHIY